jgi:small nuclear ribonucleoprotein G
VYLNIVLDEALEEKPGGEKVRIGMVVIRGNAVVMLEVGDFLTTIYLIIYAAEWTLTEPQALDRINQDVPKIGR